MEFYIMENCDIKDKKYLEYIQIHINVLTRSSEWIFNPMRFTGLCQHKI